MKFRLIPVTMTTLALGLSTLVGSPAASAAKNDWASYYPAKGTVCVMKMTNEDGVDQGTSRTRVVSKTSKKVVETSDGVRTTTVLHGNGKVTSATTYDLGDGDTLTVTDARPALARFLKGKKGSSKVVMKMTLPKSDARSMLKRGRTLALTGRYVTSRANDLTVELRDGTQVKSIGLTNKLTGLSMPNVKARHKAEVRDMMRSTFEALETSTWFAKKRGMVQQTTQVGELAQFIATQTHCK